MLLPYVNVIFSIFFVVVLFCVQNLCCNDSKYHSFNWQDVSVTNVDFFGREAVQSPVFYSLLQVNIVYRVSFILVSVFTKGFAYLLCWPRERGIGLACTRRFSFHEFYNFLPFNFFFGKLFLTHDIYPHPHPWPTTYTHYPLPTTHDI